QVQRIDPKNGQVVKSFNVTNNLGSQFGNVEILPNGNLLIGLYVNNKVAEFDLDGNKQWEAAVSQPMTVHRLPNGHTLVTSNNNQNQRRVVELDSNGQQVDTIEVDNTGMLYSAKRR